MKKYILKRIALMIVTGFAIMTVLFILIRLLPNFVKIGVDGSEKQLIAMREAWGYNKPIMVQYGIFLKKVFTEWDWGFCTEVGTKYKPVTSYISSKFPATIYINSFAMLLSMPTGIVFGVLAANYKNKWQDHMINVFIMFFISVPAFVYAFLLQYIVGFRLNLLPLVMDASTDYFTWKTFRSAIMPILSLSFGVIAGEMRYVRAELTESMTSEYMLLARTKGLTKRQALFRHAFRNSMVPLIPSFLADVIYIISGSFIIEQIFGVPGVGKLFILSITSRDYNVFMALAMFYLCINLVAGLIFDLSYGLIDPRIRMGGGKTNEY